MTIHNALISGLGLPQPDASSDDHIAWHNAPNPGDRLALAFSPTANQRLRKNGYEVIAVPSGWVTAARVWATTAARITKQRVTPMTVAHVLCRAAGAPEAGQPVRTKTVRLSLAWPDHKIALLLPGDHISRAATDWQTHQVKGSWNAGCRAIKAACAALIAARSATNATNPSSHEQKLMAALTRAGLPEARRDLEMAAPDGHVYTRPDFAWPAASLVLELDGWWPHLGRDLHETKELDNDTLRRQRLRGSRIRFEKDAAKRRRLVAAGWTVMTCTDTEIDRGETDAIATQVADVYRALLNNRRPTNAALLLGAAT